MATSASGVVSVLAGLAALGVGSFTYAAYQRDIRLARARVGTGSQLAKTRRARSNTRLQARVLQS
jgi:hypothetical protein